MHIHSAQKSDCDVVSRIHLAAFPASERQQVAKLAVDLVKEDTKPPILSLLAESDGVVVGHAAFSPVTVNKRQDCHGYILAPLAVMPDFQKQGVGSMLINAGIEQLKAADIAILFVYGDPDYYGRFGFRADLAASVIPPYPLEYPFGWQALILDDTVIGNTTINISCVSALSDPALW